MVQNCPESYGKPSSLPSRPACRSKEDQWWGMELVMVTFSSSCHRFMESKKNMMKERMLLFGRIERG